MADPQSQATKAKHGGLEDWLSENTTKVLVWIGGLAFVGAIAITVIYFAVLLAPPLGLSTSITGEVGDFFGGILNPIFGFLSMVALLVALVVQGRELRVSREELELSRVEMAKSAEALSSQNAAIEHQRFEQTFFAWLRTYRSMLDSMHDAETTMTRSAGEFIRNRTEFHGRTVLRRLKWKFERNAFDKVVNAVPVGVKVKVEPLNDSDALPVLLGVGCGPIATKEIQDAWEEMYQASESQLGGLFRVLYGLIRWIDRHTPKGSSPWLYVSIVRAQLSSDELKHLFFNGYSAKGAKLMGLANKYALFDNLDVHTDPYILIVKEAPPRFPMYEDSAFNSNLARRKYHPEEAAKYEKEIVLVDPL